MNELINLREAALRLFTGGRTGEVLNAAPPAGAALQGAITPTELAAALRDLKSAAVSADGLQVDYAALADSPAYAHYCAVVYALRDFDPSLLTTRAEQLAFWINLYNGMVLDGVVSYGVRRSVTERLAGLGFFRRIAYNVGGLRYSADDVEHGVLRANAGNPFLPGPQFAAGDPRLIHAVQPPDARIHFALNCASRSCPPIAAYNAERIDAQLDLAARSFIDADLEIDEPRGALKLSAIFSWYQADFGGPEGMVRFVRAHLPADDARRRWMDAQDAVDVIFKPYDWGLNNAGG
jgi:hypothetical protein